MKDRVCPGPDCPERIDRQYFACPDHWAELPDVLRKAVNVAFARHKRLLTVGSQRSLREAQLAATQYLHRGRAASESTT
jgi:hypothetical protein